MPLVGPAEPLGPLHPALPTTLYVTLERLKRCSPSRSAGPSQSGEVGAEAHGTGLEPAGEVQMGDGCCVGSESMVQPVQCP